jgi:hypothetical protein
MREETWIDAEGRRLRSDEISTASNDGGASRRSLIIWRGWSLVRPSLDLSVVLFCPRTVTRAGRDTLRRVVLDLDGPFAIELTGCGDDPAHLVDDPLEAVYFIENAIASFHEARRGARRPPEHKFIMEAPAAPEPITEPRDLARSWLGHDRVQAPASESLIATPLPFAKLTDLKLPSLKMALDSWNALGGVWDKSLAYMLEDHEVAHHASMVYRDQEGRLRFAWQGSSLKRLWPADVARTIKGRLVIDRPDLDFARFAEARLWHAMEANQPQLQSCRIMFNGKNGRHLFRYIALLLPLRTSRSGEANRVMSVSTILQTSAVS